MASYGLLHDKKAELAVLHMRARGGYAVTLLFILAMTMVLMGAWNLRALILRMIG